MASGRAADREDLKKSKRRAARSLERDPISELHHILATDPARYTPFYDKLKNDPGWTVHTLPCSHFIQLELPDDLTAILLKLIP
jgi:hypothetical protein